ncbi:MAG TPA: CHASE3 domain-containing protein, partial [Casimicrobiaceae bacterium]|nr:CHASE3 domain-containing protein [Casimicrobiaceae bacterium]
MWLGLALIVAPFLALIALQAYELIGRAPRLAHSRQLVVHTIEVIGTAQRLERAVADAERSQRGYLLTGEAAYLETYRTAASDAPSLVDRLAALTRDNAEQQRRMPNLALQVTTRLGELAHALAVRDHEGVEAGREAARADRGVLNETIAGLVDATVATEGALLRQRLEQVAEDERRTATVALASTVLAFAIMAMGVGVALVAFHRIRRAESARSSSEQRFRLLVDGVADHAIYTLDPKGNVADWNAGAERIKGYKAEDIVGHHFSRFYTAEDRQAGVPARALETALREGQYEAEGWRVRKDGSRFWASATISPLRDASGEEIGFAKITRDVTRQREQQLALAEARAALAQSQKMDALGQLSGGIAHDFNNLLHVISNCVEVLQRRTTASDADTRQLLDMVKRSATRGASLTQRMLAFSRRQPLQPRPSNPNRLVSGMADLLRRALGETIELETVLGSGIWSVSVDANQLEAALINLA